MADFDPEDLRDIEFEETRMRKEYAPSARQKIHSFTVVCLILNRSIGSGIFATPSKILQGTRSVGISIFFWAIGGLLVSFGVLVWLTFGLSTPKHTVGGSTRGVPRSGGEKNYFEHVLQRPRFLATCMYGIVFIILGNLSGNAIMFGRYVLFAAGRDGDVKGHVVGIAIGALTVIVLLHGFSRRGGIIVSNVFAIFKLAIFLVIIILGFAYRGGANFRDDPVTPKLGGANFNLHSSFSSAASQISNHTTTFLYVLYTYSGFEQPFYVLSEVHRPQKYFAKAVLFAMALITVLFVLVNVAYLCVVPMSVILDPKNVNVDIASLFFETVFGSEAARRVMQGAIALSIFGNIVVMTFTASRVKQEIAKEGILPKSLFFATGHATPGAKLAAWFKRRGKAEPKAHPMKPLFGDGSDETDETLGEEPLETSPMAALGLHWVSSIFLIAVTAALKPADSYNFLVTLYAYVMILVMGFFASFGLLWCLYVRKEQFPEFKPWGGPTSSIIYCICTLFFMITAFLKPEAADKQTIPWYVVPTVGLSTILWGVVWYGGLKLVMRYRGQDLEVNRRPAIVQDEEDGEWVTKFEIIDHVWRARPRGDEVEA